MKKTYEKWDRPLANVTSFHSELVNHSKARRLVDLHHLNNSVWHARMIEVINLVGVKTAPFFAEENRRYEEYLESEDVECLECTFTEPNCDMCCHGGNRSDIVW